MQRLKQLLSKLHNNYCDSLVNENCCCLKALQLVLREIALKGPSVYFYLGLDANSWPVSAAAVVPLTFCWRLSILAFLNVCFSNIKKRKDKPTSCSLGTKTKNASHYHLRILTPRVSVVINFA